MGFYESPVNMNAPAHSPVCLMGVFPHAQKIPSLGVLGVPHGKHEETHPFYCISQTLHVWYIYIYMSTLTPQPPQLIGIYGSPMECLGYTVYRSYVFEEKYMCQRPYCITHSSGLTVEVAQARFLKDEGLGQSGHSESTHRKNTQVKTLWPQNLGEVHEQGGHQAVLQHQVRCQEP